MEEQAFNYKPFGAGAIAFAITGDPLVALAVVGGVYYYSQITTDIQPIDKNTGSGPKVPEPIIPPVPEDLNVDTVVIDPADDAKWIAYNRSGQAVAATY